MPPATVLGFDFGARRIGVAVGQTLTRTATPLITLTNHNAQPDWEAIANLIREWQPAALVVGRPVQSGPPGPDDLAARIVGFRRKLRSRFGLPVHTVDESYTSTEARARIRSLRAEGVRRKTVKGDIDLVAAAILLEAWMISSEVGAGDGN